MKKKICLLIALVLMLTLAVAAAEGKSSLADFANRLKNVVEAVEGNAGEQAQEAPAAADDRSHGPAIKIDDPFFAKVRSSAYLLEDKYSSEANVMIELKNVSGKTLYMSDATITAYNAAGEVIDEETYSSYGPDMVEDGASVFVWDWFYGFDAPVAEISYFEVKVEAETSSYRTYEKIAADALVSEGIAYALVENTTENDIYGVDATIVMENAEGILLDICEISTGNAVGIFPASIMVLRDNAEDYANDGYLMEAVANAYVMYQVD